jgi:hypothetical protein
MKVSFMAVAFAFALIPGIIFLMFFVGLILKDRNSRPNEPQNAYLIHMFEQGMYAEKVMCSGIGDCLLFRSQKGVFGTSMIQVDGKFYSEAPNTFVPSTEPVARGLYCPGQIGTLSCLELVMVQPEQTCPASITYLGFSAPLVPNSCLLGK